MATEQANTIKKASEPFQPASRPVLVIENDAEFRETLYAVLESAGYPVICEYCERNVEYLFESLLSSSGMGSREIAGIVAGSRKFAPLIMDDFYGWLPKKFPHLAKRIVFPQKPFSCERFLADVREAIGEPAPSERILLVDDEEPISEIVASMLSFAGYRCRWVPNGTNALKLLESGERFDLITSDICNSPMWGISFLEEVKRRFPDIPVLMVTACHDTPTKLDCLSKGAFDYLRKPFERQELFVAVRRALESRRLSEGQRF